MNEPKQKKQPWISSRSTLEYWLGGTCLVFLVLIVLLIAALARDSAPLEAEWGNVADWAGVVVTSFGFIGAILTVHLQGRGIRIQEEQHDANRSEKTAQQAAAASRIAVQAQDELEQWAHAVDFKVIAKHRPKISWHEVPSEDGKLDLIVRATVRSGIYSGAALIVPPLPTGFEFKVDRPKSERLGASGVESLEWRAFGEGWFGGDDSKAKQWLLDQDPAVEFTDPAGVSWRKDPHGAITELTTSEISPGHR